jgi:hypothetical protein
MITGIDALLGLAGWLASGGLTGWGYMGGEPWYQSWPQRRASLEIMELTHLDIC